MDGVSHARGEPFARPAGRVGGCHRAVMDTWAEHRSGTLRRTYKTRGPKAARSEKEGSLCRWSGAEVDDLHATVAGFRRLRRCVDKRALLAHPDCFQPRRRHVVLARQVGYDGLRALLR